MKSLASAAALALLSACSGGGGYGYDEGLPPAPMSGDLGQGDESVAGASYAPPAPAYVPPPAPTPVVQARPGAEYAPPNPTGAPQGSSQQEPGETRYDAVGFAGVGNEGGISAIVPALPAGSFAELTSLESGRTIVVLVASSPAQLPARQVAELSPAAAQQLGFAPGSPLRVRRVTPFPQDQAALRQGQPAAERMDAPQSLLVALRKRLPASAPAAAPPPRAATAPGTTYPRPGAPAPATAPSRAGWYVQVAALSSNGRAQALAQQLGGFVRTAGNVYRVQLGPFANAAAARAARDGVAGRGYADARVFSQN